jgi:4,5-DOPA dioxygenase extradiol
MDNRHFDPAFIGHGSPLNAIATNAYTKSLRDFAASIEKPRAIVVISAHWQTRGTMITGSASPEQIYDFYGFPDELYQTRYAPPGSPETASLLADAGLGIEIDPRRGIDHAAWAVIRHLYPDQDVPLLELSLDIDKTEQEHFDLGTRLARFQDEGILFIGSGNLIHNLRLVSFDDDAQPFPWAVETDAWQRERLNASDIARLIEYRASMPNWQKAIPTDEHYLPLLYILGMKGERGAIETVHEEIQNASISMRCLRIR